MKTPVTSYHVGDLKTAAGVEVVFTAIRNRHILIQG